MDRPREEKLSEIINAVLEVYAFMFTSPLERPEDDVDPSGDTCNVSIRFGGARSGDMDLLLPLALASEIATTALGIDEASESESLDAARELANLICGQLITEMFGTELDVVLDIPNASLVGESAWQDWFERRDCLGLLVEQTWPLLFRFNVQEHVGT